MSSEAMLAPLTGVRVLDLSHVLAGPYATFILAQLGAEVIKVERMGMGDSIRDTATRPEQGGRPPGFVSANAGKRSIAVNLTTPEGRGIVEKLAATSDVWVENYRPGKAAKLGLGFEQVKALKPDIIYCSISAWGQTGVRAHHGGFDHVMQAATGMMMMQGDDADAPPVKVGFPVIDMATGMQAANAVLAALLQRHAAPGKARHLDISMADAGLFIMAPMAAQHLFGEPTPLRIGNRGFAASPGSSLFQTADGWLATGANTLQLFDALCTVIGHPEYATAPEYLKERPASPGAVLRRLATEKLEKALPAAFLQQSAEAWETALMAAGVPAAAVRTLPDYWDGPYQDTPGIDLPAKKGDGKAGRILGAGFRSDGQTVGQGGEAPVLGQDTARILQQLGYDPSRQQDLRARGIVQ